MDNKKQITIESINIKFNKPVVAEHGNQIIMEFTLDGDIPGLRPDRIFLRRTEELKLSDHFVTTGLLEHNNG